MATFGKYVPKVYSGLTPFLRGVSRVVISSRQSKGACHPSVDTGGLGQGGNWAGCGGKPL